MKFETPLSERLNIGCQCKRAGICRYCQDATEARSLEEQAAFIEKDRDWWRGEAERFAKIVKAADAELKRRGIRLDVTTSEQVARKLPAALGEDARDAERYRWLRPRLQARQTEAIDGSRRLAIETVPGRSFFDSKQESVVERWASHLDAAIDAALAATRTREES